MFKNTIAWTGETGFLIAPFTEIYTLYCESWSSPYDTFQLEAIKTVMDESTKWTIHHGAGCCKNGRIRAKCRWALNGMSLVIYYLIRMWHDSMSGSWLQLSEWQLPMLLPPETVPFQILWFSLFTFLTAAYIYFPNSCLHLSRYLINSWWFHS